MLEALISQAIVLKWASHCWRCVTLCATIYPFNCRFTACEIAYCFETFSPFGQYHFAGCPMLSRGIYSVTTQHLLNCTYAWPKPMAIERAHCISQFVHNKMRRVIIMTLRIISVSTNLFINLPIEAKMTSNRFTNQNTQAHLSTHHLSSKIMVCKF